MNPDYVRRCERELLRTAKKRTREKTRKRILERGNYWDLLGEFGDEWNESKRRERKND